MTTAGRTGDETPQAAGDICGHIVHTARYEWICINPPHDPHYTRRGGTIPEPGNGPHPARHDGHPAAADRHHYVNRYPYRPVPQ